MKNTMHLLFQCSVVLLSLVCQIVSLGINENYMLIENDAMIVSSASTYDTTTRTQLMCAFKCLQNINCSAASYQDTKCRLETSKNFSATQLAGATIMIREQGSVIQYRQEETMALNESFSYTTVNSENQTETVTNTTTAGGNTATQSYTTEQSGTTTNERASQTANTHMAIQTTAQSVGGLSLQTIVQTTQSDTNIDVQTTTHIAQLGSDMALQTSSHTAPSGVDTTVQTNLHTAPSGGDTTVQTTSYTCITQSSGDTTVQSTQPTQSDHNMALQTTSRTDQPDDTTVQATSHTAEGSTTKYSFITTRDGFTSTGGHSYTTKDDHSISADFKISTEEFSTTKEHKLTIRNEETTTNVLEQTSFEVLSTTHSICFSFPEYIYHNTKMSLPDAQAVCSGEGGKVVEIETAEEELCLNYLFNFYYENWYWIGAYNYNADSTYEYWSDPTSPLSFTKWENGQPTRTSSQLCIYASWSSQYKWKSGDCSLNNAFICEINQ